MPLSQRLPVKRQSGVSSQTAAKVSSAHQKAVAGGSGRSTTAAATAVADGTKATTSTASRRHRTATLVGSTRLEEGLEVTPGQGEFINFDVDTAYVLPFRLCNRSETIQTLRFVAPAQPSTAFRVVNMESVRLAPGMSHELEVEFMTHTERDYSDSFTILNGSGGAILVPLTALSAPELEHLSTIDFGAIEQHRVVGATRSLVLRNRGRRDALVTLAIESPVASAAAVAEKKTTEATPFPVLSPPSLVVPAGGQAAATVELPRGVGLGRHDWMLSVQIVGEAAPHSVDVTVEVVDSRSRLVDPATEQETLSVVFSRKVYEGVKRRYPLRVTNGSSRDVSFAFQLAADPAEVGARDVPPFAIVPEQGRLGPKESREVTVVFEPPLQAARTGWASSAQQAKSLRREARTQRFEALFSLLFVETEQTLSFHVAGESCETVVALSCSVLDFGTVAVNGSATATLEIENGAPDLPLPYSVGRAANFRVSEPQGRIPAGGAVALRVTFTPRRLGGFQEALRVDFNGGAVSRTVTLSGRASAPTKAGGRTGAARSSTTVATVTEAGESAPQRVDIGMVPAEGLTPPRLPDSAAQLERQLRREDATSRLARPSGHIAPVAFSDTRALIKRTYAEAPANTMERGDCRRELLPMDLLKVSLPIRVIDFGRLTVGATAVRSLFVFNGSDGSVLVAMPADEEQQVKFSPRRQVVPPSRMAHFDVTFHGAIVQTVQQAITFTVNTRYQMRTTLHAEVTPVEVGLSSTELALYYGGSEDYASASKDGGPIVQRQVVLSNNGNCAAAFRWRLPPPPQGPALFAILPTEGVLPPSSKLVADVTYTPPVRDGTAEVVCEARLSVDGALAEKTLRLVGAVRPTVCAWGRIEGTSNLTTSEDVVVDLKRIAAGKTLTLLIPLVSKSASNSAYFSFEALPPGCAIVPSRGILACGETEVLTLTLCPTTPGPFQHVLQCNVRGMRKQLRLNVSAEVVAPAVVIASPALVKGEVVLDYGELYVGSERVRAVCLSNNDDVPAVIEMDLRPRAVMSGSAPSSSADLFDAHPLSGYYCLAADDCTSAATIAADGVAEALKGPYAEVERVATKPFVDGCEGDVAAGAAEVFRLTLPPRTDSVVRIAFRPQTANVGESVGGGGGSSRFYGRWRQVGAEGTHPLPSLVLQAAALPPKLSLSVKKERDATSASSATAGRDSAELRAGMKTDTGAVTHAAFPSVVVGCIPRPVHLALGNLTLERLSWRLQWQPQRALSGAVPDAQSPAPFLVEPTSGEVGPGGGEAVTVTFLAGKVGSFAETFILYVNDDVNRPCGTITFTATATEPRLWCERGAVRFPTVPLGVVVRQTVMLHNKGFDLLHVRYASGGTDEEGGAAAAGRGSLRHPITVEFPEGNALSFHTPVLPALITFCSQHPITLDTSIWLTTDRSGQRIELSIHATAINSIVATETYLHATGGSVTRETPATGPAEAEPLQPFRLQRAPPAVATGSTASAISTPTHARGRSAHQDVGNAAVPPAGALEQVDAAQWTDTDKGIAFVESLTTWLNGNVLARRPVPAGQLIATLQLTHGQVLYDAIEVLFGKRPHRLVVETNGADTARTGRRGGGRERTAADTHGARMSLAATAAARADHAARENKGAASLDVLLDFMRHYGCCLSSVKTQYLLPFDEFRAQGQHGGDEDRLEEADRRPTSSSALLSAREFRMRATHAWAVVVLEMLRVFYLSRFAPDVLLRSVPSTASTCFPLERWSNKAFVSAVARGDVYSREESTLLLWLQWVANRQCQLQLQHQRKQPQQQQPQQRQAEVSSSLQDVVFAMDATTAREGTSDLPAEPVQLRSFDDLRDIRPLIAAVLLCVPAVRSVFFDGDRKVVADPLLRADLESNADLCMHALTTLGVVSQPSEASSAEPAAAGPQSGPPALSWLPTGREWVEFSQTQRVLYCAFLFTFLARFAASGAAAAQPAADSVVRFQGKLLCPITRTLTLSSAAASGWSGARRYRVWLDNHEFAAAEDVLTVPANGSANVTLVYTPRRHRAVQGQCLLIDETPVLLPSERVPVTFTLMAEPTNEPSRVFEWNTPLYEPLHTEIPVENPFTGQECCVVGVRVSQSYAATVDDATGAAASPAEAAMGSCYKKPFFFSTDVLPLRRGEVSSLAFYFVPLARGVYEARLTFREDREGEFAYLVRVRCGAPRPGDGSDASGAGLFFRSELDEPCEQTLVVRPSNGFMDRAVRLYEEKSRQQQLLGAAAAAAGRVPPQVPSLEGNAYTVEFVNDKLVGPNPFFEVAGSGDNDAGAGAPLLRLSSAPASAGGASELRFRFSPKYVGVYDGYILLTSAIDVRLIPFRGECVAKGERLLLRFSCPARQHITQNITLTNHSGEDWLFSAVFESAAADGTASSFTGPREVRVLQGRTKEYPLKYSPTWLTTEDERGKLTLHNRATGQKNVYDLVGEADAPLSEDVLYAECRAREKKTVVLTVPNIVSDACTYRVETDLPFTDGEESVTIARGAAARYTLQLSPRVGGNYSGKVVFRAVTPGAGAVSATRYHAPALPGRARPADGPSPAERFVWFVVNLSVTPPDKEGVVELETDARTAVVADVSITNPLDEKLLFTVTRFGAGLTGLNSLELPPNAAGVYSCTFVPSLIGTFDGRLSFFNDAVGEFWYEVRMRVVDSPAEELSFKAAVGSPSTATVRLPNRSSQECQLMTQNANTTNFVVSPAVVVVPPNEDAIVDITYKPTAVGEEQSSQITFSHPVLGRWRYVCRGVGSAPAVAPARELICELGSSVTLSLPFENCLDVDTTFHAEVTCADASLPSPFTLQPSAAAAERVAVPTGGRTNFTVGYRPRAVGQHMAAVEVRPSAAAQAARYDMCWVFPLHGRAEWRDATTAPLRFRCAARRQLEDTVELPAPGLTPEERSAATVAFEPDAAAAAGAASSLNFEYALVPPGDASAEQPRAVGAGGRDGDGAVVYLRVKFTPLRPTAVSGDLVVRGGGTGGGIWRYRTHLEAPPAPFDDTITISSALHDAASVSFDLYNVFPFRSTFAAYFTPDSSKDLSVSPLHGVLLPFVTGQQRGGGAAAVATPIRVSFTPSLRVPQVEGTLVVDTEEMQWSFKVIGKLTSRK